MKRKKQQQTNNPSLHCKHSSNSRLIFAQRSDPTSQPNSEEHFLLTLTLQMFMKGLNEHSEGGKNRVYFGFGK